MVKGRPLGMVYSGGKKRKVSRATNQIKGEEIRAILDLMLSGRQRTYIAEEVGRTVDSIITILDNKIPGNVKISRNNDVTYVDMLWGCRSVLDPRRTLATHEILYAKKCLQRKLNIDQCARVMVLPVKKLAKQLDYTPPIKVKKLGEKSEEV
jgi:hypothetical protein